MTSDPLADRVRDAVGVFAVPAMPAPLIAARITAERAKVPSNRRRPIIAAAGGIVLLAAALAVGVRHEIHMPPAYWATLKRLTGHDFRRARIYQEDLPPMTLAEARRHTSFPIVVPRGKRVLDVHPYPDGAGVTLIVAVDVHAQAQLEERWAGARPSTWASKLEGVGIHDDGTIRRFNIRRWRIGRIQFSTPMFTLEYHRYAEELERATREVAAP